MTRRRIGSFYLAAILLLLAASPVLANSLTPALGFIPGLMPLGFALAFPVSVVAAFLERPFVSRAGVPRHALWYSLQANFLSLVVGFLTLPLTFAFFDSDLILLWCFVAVALSIFTEGWYYQKGAAPAGVRWKWIILGNVFSNAVLLMIPIAATAVRAWRPELRWYLGEFENPLTLASFAASLVLFIVSFIVPLVLRRLEARRSAAAGCQEAPEIAAVGQTGVIEQESRLPLA